MASAFIRSLCCYSMQIGFHDRLRPVSVHENFFNGSRSLSHLPVRPVYFIAPALGRPLLERDVSVSRVAESRAKVYTEDWKM